MTNQHKGGKVQRQAVAVVVIRVQIYYCDSNLRTKLHSTLNELVDLKIFLLTFGYLNWKEVVYLKFRI
ncbi:hypothetical protein QVD17_35508 [Tagetes erecta]|uniref:Uncharacterized protein n=1 Tax=Tagetes erecta TaxID=13708 RepID=A0AAD8K129_TARER|nr:hypothetical protein QVD17_35508 [Tagetes erecta]